MSDSRKITFPLLNFAIFAILLITLTIMSALSLIIHNEYSKTLKNQQDHTVNNLALQFRDNILRNIHNHQTILKDYSRFRLLNLAVLQPENSLEDAVDLMKSFSFLGKQHPLILCDFEGNPLQTPKAYLQGKDKIKTELSASKNFEVTNNIQLNNRQYIILSSPIVLNNSVEGALCLLIPLDEIIKDSMPKDQEPFQFIITKDGEAITEDILEPEGHLQSVVELTEKFTLTVFVDPVNINKGLDSLFKSLFSSMIIIIIILALASFWVLNKFFLKPVTSLGTLSHSIAISSETTPQLEESPIKELALLKDDMLNMIAALKQRSKDLNVANEELEARVKRRTAELEEKATELEKLSQYKSEFLARMSHEIRTPMNAIIGYTDILKETSLSEEQSNQLKIISSSADALLVVINDILDFSKLEAGMMTVEKIPFDLKKILTDAKSLFTKQADDKGLDFEVEKIPDENHWFTGDPYRIRQIIINLTGNALKFTHRGKVSIKTSITAIKGKKHRLDICVEDSGIGIPQDKIDDIFNSFSQAEGSVSRKYGGTGLGLPISKELAELMGGSLSVTSKVDEGTTFRFSIILEKANPVTVDTNSQNDIIWSRQPDILLVEDNKVNLKLAEKTLRNFKVNFTSCENGLSALEVLESGQHFDLILMDCQMPEMDGLEATRRLRKIPHLETLPVIAFTANALDHEIEECYKAGMNDYIGKPFKKEVFNQKLRKWLPHLVDEKSDTSLAS